MSSIFWPNFKVTKLRGGEGGYHSNPPVSKPRSSPPGQVLWLQRVKELKVQCEGLREEANIAASNSVSGSVEFSQGQFASRILASLSNLITYTQVRSQTFPPWKNILRCPKPP